MSNFDHSMSHDIVKSESLMDGMSDQVFDGQINTKVACLACRDKKLKCDKLLPICTRCKSKNVQCVYVSHKKTGPKPSSSKRRREVDPSEDFEQNTFNNNSNNNSNDNPNNNSVQRQSKFTRGKELHKMTSSVELNSSDMSAFILTDDQKLKIEPTISINNYQLPSPYNASSLSINYNNEHNNLIINDIGPMPSYPPMVSYDSSHNISMMDGISSFTDSNLNSQTPPKNSSNQENKNQSHESHSVNKPIPQTVPSLNDLIKLNSNLNQDLKLNKLRLSVDDVDKFHNFYFNSNVRPFKYSMTRHFSWLKSNPKNVSHYSLMIWAIASFYLNDYNDRSQELYECALEEMNYFWKSNNDSFHTEILPYLHSLCLKAQFEFMSGREMRAGLTIASSIRLSQMFGYDQIDLSKNMLGTPEIFFKSSTSTDSNDINTNFLLKDDNLDNEIPLVEERRRILWEVYAIDKWSSLVSGLPCAFSVDNHNIIFTKLPSPTTFLPLQTDSNLIDINTNSNTEEQNSYYLHEAMAKLDRNQVLIDINSSSSKVLLLTISENIIKWCKMFLNMVELDSLKSDESIDSIRHKVDELVKNFESMHNNLLFFDLTTEPLMNIVISNTTTLLYQSVLIKFSSLFEHQIKERSIISTKEIQLFKDLLNHVSTMSSRLILKFINKPKMDHHLKKVPVFVVFLNSIKSLFQCAAFLKRFKKLLNFDKVQEEMILSTLNLVKVKVSEIEPSKSKLSVVEKVSIILKNGDQMLNNNPHLLSFFNSFYEAP